MDLTTRKYKFIEQFMRIVNPEKIRRLEEVLRLQESECKTVAYTVKGKPLAKEDYIQQIKDADASISAGKFTTVEDLEKEVQNW